MFVCSRLAGAQGREWNAQGTKGRDGKRENEANWEKRKSKKVMMKEYQKFRDTAKARRMDRTK